MSGSEPSWNEIIEGLNALAGARIQRVDRFDERGLSLQLRVPGRTLCLVLDPIRIRLVSRRPVKRVDGGELQRFLRKRLHGAIWISAERKQGTVHIGLDGGNVSFDPRGGKDWIRFEARSSRAPAPSPHVPDRIGGLEDDGGPTDEAEARAEALRVRRLARLRADRKRLERLVRRVDEDRNRMARLSEKAHLGELMKAQLHTLQRGQQYADVMDWATGATSRIELDPALSPVENLERFFAQAKKGVRGLPVAESRLTQAKKRLEVVEEELERWAAASTEDVLQAEAEKLEPQGSEGPKASSAGGRRRLIDQWSRRYLAEDGSEIRVGKSARDNDQLSLRGSRSHDRWLHARGVTGAHVILRVEKGREPRPEALLDAAHLAVHFSELRGEGKADVLLTEARHVKKTKGAAPGLVGVSNARTLQVVMEASRLRRLLGQFGPDSVR